MKKIYIKRQKNIWIPIKNNFCTPFVKWDFDLDYLEKIIPINLRLKLISWLSNQTEINCENNQHITWILRLISLKLQSLDSSEIFLWLITISKKHDLPEFSYPFLDEKVADYVGPLSMEFLIEFSKHNYDLNEFHEPKDLTLSLFNIYQEKISKVVPFPSSLNLILEAKKRGIPTIRHSDLPSYQLGYGKYLNLISKGYTGNTSKLATNITTNKFIAAKLMRQASLPVPKHFIVKNIESAKKAAEIIKFPAVIKPNSTDKGLGITANIKDKNQIDVAWPKAARYGSVLLEEMIEGFDHRLHVINGTCVYVTRRVPPYVIGDGITSIEALIQKYVDHRSSNPEYKNFRSAQSSDPVVIEFLATQGYKLKSILEKGKLLYLRSNANVSTGGVANEVTKDCHSDNILLAEKAARIVGLDNAGVDFITTDISISWKISGGKITEVNPTPAFGLPIGYPALIDYLYPNNSNGQIPIILIIGESILSTSYLDSIIKKNQQHNISHAYITDKKLYTVSKHGTLIIEGDSTQELINSALMDINTQFITIHMSSLELKNGLDLCYISLIVICDNVLDPDNDSLGQRCLSKNILTNPTIKDFQEALKSLPPNVQ